MGNVLKVMTAHHSRSFKMVNGKEKKKKAESGRLRVMDASVHRGHECLLPSYRDSGWMSTAGLNEWRVEGKRRAMESSYMSPQVS